MAGTFVHNDLSVECANKASVKTKWSLRRWNTMKNYAKEDKERKKQTENEQVRRWKSTHSMKNSLDSNAESPQILDYSNFQSKSASPKYKNIESGSVVSYETLDSRYFFIFCMENADIKWAVKRRYEDIYNFHLILMDKFPEEAGKSNAEQRCIPRFPAPRLFVDEALKGQRLEKMQEYCQSLFEMPLKIRQCKFFNAFFCPREGDCYELPAEEPAASHSESILLKVKNQSDVIKLQVSADLSLSDLVSICSRKFSETIPSRFKYVDDDGDHVVVADDEDLAMFLSDYLVSRKPMTIEVENLAEI